MDNVNWSTEKPTEAGFYWLWFGDDILDPEVVEIEIEHGVNVLEVLQIGVEGGVALEKYHDAFWAPVSSHPPMKINDGSPDVGC